MTFATVLASARPLDGGFALTVTDDWLQGRTAFGGLTAALAYEVAKRAGGEGLHMVEPDLRDSSPDERAVPHLVSADSIELVSPSQMRLARLARLRWTIELDYRQLKGELGLDHYEGRSYAGFHHHCALVSLAHAFLTLERLDPKVRRPA